MSIKQLYLPAILGIATLAFSGLPSEAAIVPNPNPGDLFLGFRASGGQGASTSLLVNLGNDTAFPTTLGTNITLNLGSLGLDLIATYGNAWFSRDDLSWGIFGGRQNSGNPILYASIGKEGLGAPSAAWPALSLDARNGTYSKINSVLTACTNSTATANSPTATLQTNAANDGSYNFQVATAGTTDFGSLSQWTGIEGTFAAGTSGTALDVYRIAGSGVTQRGTFAISDNGVVTYSVVPEPSSSFLLVTAGALLGARRRRAASPVS